MAKRKLSSDINVVPYIDVMLVLLIIFMVTAPLLVQGIDVELPEADAASLSSQEDEVVLSVTARGELMLNVGDKQGVPLSDEEVVERIGAIIRARPDKLILVEGDARVPYQHVAHGMALLQQGGARKIGFVTQPREQTSRR
ncbi:Cell division and transport-associated protein TolR [Fontimonas thermophila]|uniref:Tol-Pal system protein TolR n=1 Tax=Fontimonas thermophila TaxID=1076937 RepID=A0A1I2HR43_9GAMM|nr:protein TolR [Fontimonas thermophila]SFF32142.1 Cell division and transport-associated protein TolR [Fontimonas thermophila]